MINYNKFNFILHSMFHKEIYGLAEVKQVGNVDSFILTSSSYSFSSSFLTVQIVRSRQWCEMMPCLDDEGCDLLVNRTGWTCAQPGGRVKTTTVSVTKQNNSGLACQKCWCHEKYLTGSQ